MHCFKLKVFMIAPLFRIRLSREDAGKADSRMVIDLARVKARQEVRSYLLAASAEALTRGDLTLHSTIISALNSLSNEDVSVQSPTQGESPA